MNKLLALTIIGTTLLGCQKRESHDALLQTWRSRESNLQQRFEAIKELIPDGASYANAIGVLGSNGRWVHVGLPPLLSEIGGNTNLNPHAQGPFLNQLVPVTNPTPNMMWTYEYEFRDGIIFLRFENVSSSKTENSEWIFRGVGTTTNNKRN